MPTITGITMRWNMAFEGTVSNFSHAMGEHTDSGIEWTWIFPAPLAGTFDLNFYISLAEPFVPAELVLLEICYFEA